MTKGIIAPRSLKQKMFIDNDADITIFGGAMGSGKTYLGIMKFLQYIHIPTFRGIITRRTTPQLTGVGGILDTAMDMFKKVDPKVKYNSQTKQFRFSSGATVALQHFEHVKDKDNYQGLQANLILVDEAAQFEESQVTYLRGRNRNPKCPEVHPRMLLTCNPEKTSFLRVWLDWWLDDGGYPRKDRDGVKRYYLPVNGKMHWADTPDELIEEHHKMFKNRSQCIPTSVSFISANIYDNPVLMESQPDYIGNLLGMGKVEQAKYLHGCWDSELESSGYWKRQWCQMVDKRPLHVVKRVRAWDLAGTLPSDTNPNPDYTVGTLLSKDKFGKYVVEDVVRFRGRHGEVFDRILKTAKEDGVDTLISIPREIGVGGKFYTQTIIRDLAEHGFYAKAKPAQKGKLERFAPFCAASENGGVDILIAEWNEEFFQELEGFDGGKKRRHDDIVDSCADAYMMLATTTQIPIFSMPDLKTSTPYDFAS